MASKLSVEYQQRFLSQLIFDPLVFDYIDPSVKLHEETKQNPLSSAASCLNVIGSLMNSPAELIGFLQIFGLEVEELYKFPSPVSFEKRLYQDRGYAIFEWVGPQISPLNEVGGGRGQNRTSVDIFMLGRVHGKTTQILIEWKFTEGLSRPLALGRFCGQKGTERLRRYSAVLAELRKKKDFPLDFAEEFRASDPKSSFGLYDLSPNHLYQLLRMTLLAKTTYTKMLGKYVLEDYRVLHLSHSRNERLNTLHPEYLIFSPGLQRFSGQLLHDVWREILAVQEREKFISGYWDQAIHTIENVTLKNYLANRYLEE
jgi:hypothetical protein